MVKVSRTPQDPSGVSKTGNTSYQAPALEKGLDILENISAAETSLTQLQIAKNLERTPTEIFRMLNVLERRGYITREADSTYKLSLKLFELSHRHPPTRKLLSVALPIMQQLAIDSRQSAHLVVHHQNRILVIAQVDSPEPMSFGVKLGTHYPVRADRTSARALAAFSPTDIRHELILEMIRNTDSQISSTQLETEFHTIRKNGYYESVSLTTAGVTDVSCPIYNHKGNAIAVITVPFLKQSNIPVSVEDVRNFALKAAQIISQDLGYISDF